MKKLLSFTIGGLLLVTPIHAQFIGSNYDIYIAVSQESFAVGGLWIPNFDKSGLAIGMDVGFDGYAEDNTFDSDGDVSNIVLLGVAGAVFDLTPKSKMTLLGLFGIRSVEEYCPEGTNISYLGYRCYADTDHQAKYEGVVGIMSTVSYSSLFGGLRIKSGGVSEIVLGYRF